MHRLSRPEGLDLAAAQIQANSSPPRNRTSMSPSYSLISAPAATPDPAYIAASAASQIVSSEHQSQYRDWSDGREGQFINETAVVSPSSLNLVNAFLDRLLFNFLASARSTSLGSLRPAVAEVLKPRLAKEAITGADEELQEFLGGGDDEELMAFHNGQEPSSEWDLDLVWKRTRLRCMVYTRLGDMEEEDEEMYIEQEHLEDTSQSRRVSRDLGIVSPAAAIFLTSILEFIGEQALMVAGEAAYMRIENENPRVEKRKSTTLRRVVVEEIDIEKVAFNTTLGRLWRSWRRLVRSPKSSVSRSIAQDMVGPSGMHTTSRRSGSRKSSFDSIDGEKQVSKNDQRPSVAEVLTASEPESIPLPSTDHDVAEIEVPGYSPLAIRRCGNSSVMGLQNRPYSMIISPELKGRSFTPTSSRSQSPVGMQSASNAEIVNTRHHRSYSLPTPTQTPFILAREYQSSVSDVSSRSESPNIAPLATEGTLLDHEEESVSRVEPIDSNKSSSSTVERLANGTPNSSATSAFQGSVLNAISRHAARELELRSRAATGRCKNEPDVLEDDTIYEWNKAPIPTIEGPRDIMGRTRYDSSNSIQTFTIGDVSPMVGEFSFPGQMSVESGEVSPIDPSEDDEPYSSASGLAPFSSDALSGRGNQDYAVPASPSSRRENLSTDGLRSNLYSAQGRQRRVDGPTKDDITKEDNREAYVVFDDLPSSQSVRTSDTSTLSGRDLQLDGTILRTGSQKPDSENMLLPLIPLKETIETSKDTLEQEPLSTPNQPRRLSSPYGTRSASLSSSAQSQSHTRKHSNGNKASDLRHQLPAVNTNSGYGFDRAAVQRVSPSQLSTREPGTSQVRRSDSSNRDLRPFHASTSSTSPVSQKIRGFVGRQHGDDNRERIPSRASSDGGRSAQDEKHMLMVEDPNNKEQSFEQLISSGETLQYTLTPQTMREIEASDSGRWSSSKRLNSAQVTDHSFRKGPPSSGHSSLNKGWTAVASPEKMNGLRSNPIASKPRSTSDATTMASSARPTFQITSGPSGPSGPSGLTPKRADQPVPRDARVDQGTTRDFADFIRSTGPEQVKSLPKVPASRPTTASRPNTVVAGSLRSPGAASPRTLTKSPSVKSPTSIPKRPETRPPKKLATRLQARDATINRSDESSDLIDFIRQGPPIDHSDGGHRIPRTVAPFRSTKDSDEMHDLVHGRYKDTSSVASTQGSSVQTKSLHSSINSRTGLLDSTNRSNTKLGTVSTFEELSHTEEPPHPMRKRRRVKDPYAIDSDSDGDDQAMITPKPREEESLLDFLNSVAPPSQGITVPSAFDNIPKTSGKTLQRKVSGASMRARFARSSSSPTPRASTVKGPSSVVKSITTQAVQTSPSAAKSLVQKSTFSPNYRGRNEAQAAAPTFSARETSPHLTSRPASKLDTLRPTQPTFAAHLDRQRNGATRTGAKAAQPRVERGEVDNMRDLADFLKNSGPPEPARPVSPDVTKEKSGFSRMFSGRKKGVGLT